MAAYHNLHQATATLSPHALLEARLNSKTMLRGLRNIGPTIADRLDTVGLNTVRDLKRIGSVKAFKLIKGRLPRCHDTGLLLSLFFAGCP